MFKNMKIGARLASGFGIMILLLAVLIFVGINSINKIHGNLDDVVNIDNAREELANNMIDDVREVSIELRTVLLDRSATILEVKKKLIEDLRKNYDANFQKYQALVSQDKKVLIDQIEVVKVLQTESRSFNDAVLKLLSENKYDEGLDLMLKNATPKVREWISSVNNLINLEAQEALQSYENSTRTYENVRILMLILSLIACILAISIAFLLTLSITKPLGVITTLVTKRDLSTNISDYKEGNSELSMMIRSFSNDISERLKLEKEMQVYRDQLEDMVKQRTADLSNLILEVRETVNVLASSSSQILAATTQVATGTAETSTAISETSTTVEEVQQAAKLSAQKAKNVADNAQQLVKVFQNGQKAVEATINGMDRIREQMDSIAETVIRLSEQSQSIGGIIASVTDIADQSNLLAVNAAIEAAKAGDQGKGFAVVAQEIKNLAGQSKQATTQVRNILNDVQKATGAAVMATEQGGKAVELGVKQSMQAGEAIRILAESSNEAVQAATQIVASSQQQVVGMDQIGVAMQNINQAGTETAVSMVQAEKSARSLHELGQKLKDMIDKFNL